MNKQKREQLTHLAAFRKAGNTWVQVTREADKIDFKREAGTKYSVSGVCMEVLRFDPSIRTNEGMKKHPKITLRTDDQDKLSAIRVLMGLRLKNKIKLVEEILAG